MRPLSVSLLMLFAHLGAVQPGGLQPSPPTEAPGAGAPFLATEILGRPTDSSVTINAVAAIDLIAFVEYSDDPEASDPWTPTPSTTYAPGEVIEVRLAGLEPDVRYSYRLRYRAAVDEGDFATGPVRSFHTQRPPGSTFVFTVQSDSHLQNKISDGNVRAQNLYARTMQNAAAGAPDFVIDLGDTFQTEMYHGIGNATSYAQAYQRHMDQRAYFGILCHSAPLFVALGNHEGEQGWRTTDPDDELEEWAADARRALYPNPDPATDAFFTGNQAGWENYYAWEWGDALFVVLDPYRYTMLKPHSNPPQEPATGDRWDWSLGDEQYAWLTETLESSDATFKFVFAHQVTGGTNLYGRGGAEAASHTLGRRGSYEWGGENRDGTWGFAQNRPGWAKPVHHLLRDTNVALFFHGHDHVFVRQDIDGIVYQETPTPSDDEYTRGFSNSGRYYTGIEFTNSGHLRVTVSVDSVQIEYVRSYLDGEGPNADVEYSYGITDCNLNGIPDAKDLITGALDCNDPSNPAACETPCLRCEYTCADLDGSGGAVNLTDFALFAGCYLEQPTFRPECICADINVSGVVDLTDFSQFAAMFLSTTTHVPPGCPF